MKLEDLMEKDAIEEPTQADAEQSASCNKWSAIVHD